MLNNPEYHNPSNITDFSIGEFYELNYDKLFKYGLQFEKIDLIPLYVLVTSTSTYSHYSKFDVNSLRHNCYLELEAI